MTSSLHVSVLRRMNCGDIIRSVSRSAVRQHNPEVADVGAGGAGLECVAELGEKRVGIGAAKEVLGIELQGGGAAQGVAVGQGASGGAVAVHTVGPGAQDNERLSGDLGGAIESKGLIATSDS